jgi:hypothetical protein
MLNVDASEDDASLLADHGSHFVDCLDHGYDFLEFVDTGSRIRLDWTKMLRRCTAGKELLVFKYLITSKQ